MSRKDYINNKKNIEEILSEWGVEENGKYDLSIHKQYDKYWWICLKNSNHKWETTIWNRKQGKGCPYCSNNKVSKERSLGALFPEIAVQLSDKSIDPFTLAPFSSKRLEFQCELNHEYVTTISNRTYGKKCPYCLNRKVLQGFNDLLSKYPEVVKDWDYEKNHPLKPEHIVYGSPKKICWKCHICNNLWKNHCYNRTRRKDGCPYCSGRKASNINNITLNSILNKEYDRNKNNIEPKDLVLGSHKKVWWKCSKCNHSWKSCIYSRPKHGCPKCCNSKNFSKAEEEIYNLLLKKCPKEIFIWNRKIKLGNKNYKPDILMPDKKIVIEYYGDYWHCNPRLERYKDSNYYHKHKKMTAKEIWKHDTERIQVFKDAGYDVVIIWGSDWKKNNKDTMTKLFETLNVSPR